MIVGRKENEENAQGREKNVEEKHREREEEKDWS